VVALDPVLDETAILAEQTQKVVGLAQIRRRGHRDGPIEITGGPVRGHRRCLMGMGRAGSNRAGVRTTPVPLTSCTLGYRAGV
jgi:hypothetical protein